MEQTLKEISKKMDLLSAHVGLEMANQMQDLAEALERNFIKIDQKIDFNHQEIKKLICKK